MQLTDYKSVKWLIKVSFRSDFKKKRTHLKSSLNKKLYESIEVYSSVYTI